mmetsp:Transcript_695/g.957  ORF Transcript_695/g.957 Transcript_695/m.957 type:complete len:242 (-) Transcript_695:136-861(-)|eukprot:CAMPEP_0197252024 /NCGR_PEP_ID=MMETSP1429-20130617/59517_1 /TAXON_ID=49237 /ORGANISM="Chaetoceros  sp., Strain UNC1202" /LENGTH=241 /DNA_ID=CAMNT_0042714271 /DNA_START=102 /DNA_END=827 /DNA_ORIENTATION=+
MDLAEPARRVSPATADMAEAVKSVRDDDEYRVEEAQESDEALGVAPANSVDPAVPLDDPMKFAPVKQLNEKHRDEAMDVPLSKLRQSPSGVSFESPVGITKGLQMTWIRLCCPCLFDERDFVSYGEILRYVAIQDHTCFVYTEASDSNPLYTIPLETLKPVKENPRKPHKRSITVSPMANTNLQGEALQTVLLLDDLGHLAFQFTFDSGSNGDLADQFLQVVQDVNLAAKAQDKNRKNSVV